MIVKTSENSNTATSEWTTFFRHSAFAVHRKLTFGRGQEPYERERHGVSEA